jgi:FkbM family methyltransferase
VKKIFDIGMYDGADTAYYLECGYHVVAVEANPGLVDNAKRRFGAEIASGQLTCVNAAISPNGEEVELALCGQDLSSSSLFSDRIAHRQPIGVITVPGVNAKGWLANRSASLIESAHLRRRLRWATFA